MILLFFRTVRVEFIHCITFYPFLIFIRSYPQFGLNALARALIHPRGVSCVPQWLQSIMSPLCMFLFYPSVTGALSDTTTASTKLRLFLYAHDLILVLLNISVFIVYFRNIDQFLLYVNV